MKNLGNLVAHPPRPWVALAFVTYAGVFFLWLVTHPADESTVRAVQNAGGAIPPTIAALLFMRTALRQGQSTRGSWMMLTAGCAAWGAGDWIWTFYDLVLNTEVPFPSLADAAYLCGYPLLFLGLLRVTTPRRSSLSLRAGLDALGVVAAVGTVMAALILQPIFEQSGATLMERFLTAAYPMGDLALLFAVLVALPRSRNPAAGTVLLIFGMGVAAILATDLAFSYLALDQSYTGTSLMDIGWVIGYLLLGYSAILQADWSPKYGRSNRTGHSWRQLVPLALLPAMVGWLFTDNFKPDRDAITGAFAFSFVALVVMRQAINFLDAVTLNQRLRNAYRAASRARAELNRLNRQLTRSLADEQERATTDPLTGVLNRAAITDLLNDTLATLQPGDGGCAVGLADINSLKDVNDHYGHLVGDEQIKCVAQSLQVGDATVGRIGGDEFLVIIPNTDLLSVRLYQREVRSRLAEAARSRSRYPGGVAISIGFAIGPDEGKTAEELLHMADERMYLDKLGAHNNVVA